MSFAPGSGNPGTTFNIYNQSGYSSASDVEGSNITDYSDHETGYSSTTSTGGFEFISPTTQFQPSPRVPPYIRGYTPTSSTSPAAPLYTTVSPQQSNVTSPTTPGGGQPTTQYQRIARFVGPPPVALACTECRSRHLKCDAGTPSCSRCLADKRECNYIKSRRGWKGTRRKKSTAAAAGNSATTEAKEGDAKSSAVKSGTDTEGPEVLASKSNAPAAATAAPRPAPPSRSNSISSAKKSPPPPPVPTGNFSPPPPGPHTNPLETLRSHQRNSTRFPSQQEPPNDPPQSANLMQLYYTYFHDSHPFCLPPAYLIKASPHQLTVLLPVMRYIASAFAKSAPTDTFCREAENALFGANSSPPRNAFTVQALLLFSIGLHSENEQERAAQVKDIAADLALELGMNHQEFSQNTGGEGDLGRVLEESWRRTWWELYFLDGLLAGIHQRDHFRLWSVECTVPLPCEEKDYAAGKIPEPHSLQEFDERYFSDSNTVFSSFAYRVEAVRILGQALAASGGVGGVAGDDIEMRQEAADASLVNWGLHLPQVKKELVREGGVVDEMLFQAHMVINAAIIYLNRPKSHLAISIVPDDTTLTPPTSWSTPTKPMALHTARTLTAANTISKLITLPTPLVKHTPLFTSMITLACVVHLSACSWLLSGDEGFLAKERIRLGVGGLKTLSTVWAVAGSVLQQIRFVAREVFRLPPPGEMSVGPMGPGQGGEEEVLRFMEEERGVVVGDADWQAGRLEWDGT